MGVSIHYKGRIAHPAPLQQLRRDLLRFAERVHWEYLDLTGPDESQILEIILYPPGECEPVFFLIDSEGRLHPPYEVEAEEGDDSLWCSVKTQYGPLEAHVRIVELLKQIQHDYAPGLEISDEGSYWETGNLETLRSAREFLAHKMTLLPEALSNTEAKPSERSPEDLCDTVEEAAEKSVELRSAGCSKPRNTR